MHTVEPLVYGERLERSTTVLLNSAPNGNSAELVSEGQASHLEQPCNDVQWGGKRRAFKRIEQARAVEEINARALLNLQAVEAVYLFKKGQGVTVAAHEEMLAVVNCVASLRVP